MSSVCVILVALCELENSSVNVRHNKQRCL